jgi:hypothetical protein
VPRLASGRRGRISPRAEAASSHGRM